MSNICKPVPLSVTCLIMFDVGVVQPYVLYLNQGENFNVPTNTLHRNNLAMTRHYLSNFLITFLNKLTKLLMPRQLAAYLLWLKLTRKIHIFPFQCVFSLVLHEEQCQQFTLNSSAQIFKYSSCYSLNGKVICKNVMQNFVKSVTDPKQPNMDAHLIIIDFQF